MGKEDVMIQLNRIGHVLLRVADIERSKAFYTNVLGFEVVEQDPEHGGVFMSLGEHGHTLDLSPVENPETAAPVTPNRVGSITLPSWSIAKRLSKTPILRSKIKGSKWCGPSIM
jgi:catechol 2,3-dioxygenase-like lactoylglutathione lyase family enzyme